MKKAILVFGLFIVTTVSAKSENPDYQLSKLFYGEQISQIISSMNEMVLEDQKQALSKKLTLEKETVLQEIATVYSKSFTVSEIQEILTFYNSAVGKKMDFRYRRTK